jgi:hypothetical protein
MQAEHSFAETAKAKAAVTIALVSFRAIMEN